MSKSKHNRRRPPDKPRPTRRIPVLTEVCTAPDDFLGKLDVAALNLMCASGLPGAENLDYGKLFDWLDRAARLVDSAVRACYGEFKASPHTFHHSYGFFCCHMLLQVLQVHCGVRYNPRRAVDPTWQDRKREPDFRDSRDLFIHGIIHGPGGTCGSIPVLYVAVGRRLGYPLKLVEARGHLFFRWDDPLGLKRGEPDRVNIEGSGHGISTFPDDHYRTWPEPWTEEEKKANCYLRSLSPKEELASFLCARAACLEDNGRFDEAVQAYRWACGLVPKDARPLNNLRRLIWRLQKDVFEMNAVIAMQRQQRERAARQGMIPGLPPAPIDHDLQIARSHGSSCRCFHCEQVRRRTSPPEQRVAGHPIGCNCGFCEDHRFRAQ